MTLFARRRLFALLGLAPLAAVPAATQVCRRNGGAQPAELPSIDAALSFAPGEVPAYIRTAGFRRPGDGGGALWRCIEENAEIAYGSARIKLASGQLYEIAEAVVRPEMFGAIGDGRADDTRALQTALDFGSVVDFGGAGKVFLLAGTLRARSGQRLLFSGAALRQSVPNTQILNVDDVADLCIDGARLEGVGVDFVNKHGFSSGIRGQGVKDLDVRNCHFEHFAETALTVTQGQNIKFRGNVVVGPQRVVRDGKGFVPVKDGTCYGLVVGASGIIISDNTISQTCQGIGIHNGSSDVLVSTNVIRDIVGQHGMYLQSGLKNLVVSGNVVENVSLQGIKVQNDGKTGPSQGIMISGNLLSNTGSHGILVIGLGDFDRTSHLGVTISGNTVARTSVDECISVVGLDNGTISGNMCLSAGRDGIRIMRSKNVVILSNVISAPAANGIRGAGANGNVMVRGNSVVDPAQGARRGEDCGILITEGENWSIDDNSIIDRASRMRFGVAVLSDRLASCTVCRNSVVGAVEHGARFEGGDSLLRYADNILIGALGSVAWKGIGPQRGNEGRWFFAASKPANGTWQVGDVVWNSRPSADVAAGWVCVAAGAPGEWRELGRLSA